MAIMKSSYVNPIYIIVSCDFTSLLKSQHNSIQFTHSSTCMSTSTNQCFIDGKSSSLHSRVSGHQWKYITERKQSTSASTLTINLRVRGPCRVCEKTRSRWWERYVTQKDTTSKMGFCQHRNEGNGAAEGREESSGYEKDSSWAVVSAEELYSLSLSRQKYSWFQRGD